MNLHLLIGLFLFAVSSCKPSANDFDYANQQFQKGDFSGAASTYEKILLNDGHRAAVYFNLGNSYQRLSKYGLAILAYERARVLTPHDPDLLTNLTLARKAAATFEDSARSSWIEVITHRFTRNGWSWLVVLAAWFLGGLAITLVRMKLPRREVTIAAGAAVLIILLGSVSLYLRRDEANRGIVLSEDAAVRLSPFKTAESIGTPGTGRLVRLGEKQGEFQHIEVGGSSLKGWIMVNDVAAIAPNE
jgi:tetratricopeptide (TPR) repeat protein